jgi:hypothetical protein
MLESAALLIGTTSSSDVGCPTTTSQRAREVAHPQLFRVNVLKKHCSLVEVAHPPVVPALRKVSLESVPVSGAR